MKGPRGLAALLLLLLVAASARADAVHAEGLLLDGPILLPDGGRLVGTPLALYLDGTDRVRSFTASAREVRVTVFEQQAVSGNGLAAVTPGPSNRSYVLHDVEVETAPGAWAGDLGVYPEAGTRIGIDLAPSSVVAASGLRDYGDPGAGAGDEREGLHYHVRVDADHVMASDPGVLTLDGPATVKVNGLDLTLRSRENTTTLATGESRAPLAEPLAVGERRDDRWVVLEFRDGAVRIDTAAPVDVALADATLSWSGRGTLRPHEGSKLRLDGHDVPGGEAVSIVGEFSARLQVEPGERGRVLRIDLRGEGVTAAGAAIQSPGARWLPLALLGLAAVASAGVAGYVMHRRRRAPVDVDEMVTLAHLAGEGGRHDEALAWIRRARQHAPQSGTLALEEGFHLGELGLVAEALAVYRDAAGLLGDGQAEFDAALLGLRARQLLDAEAERLLIAALDRNPGLVLELEDADAATRLPRGPALAAAMLRAKRRLDEA